MVWMSCKEPSWSEAVVRSESRVKNFWFHMFKVPVGVPDFSCTSKLGLSPLLNLFKRPINRWNWVLGEYNKGPQECGVKVSGVQEPWGLRIRSNCGKRASCYLRFDFSDLLYSSGICILKGRISLGWFCHPNQSLLHQFSSENGPCLCFANVSLTMTRI